MSSTEEGSMFGVVHHFYSFAIMFLASKIITGDNNPEILGYFL